MDEKSAPSAYRDPSQQVDPGNPLAIGIEIPDQQAAAAGRLLHASIRHHQGLRSPKLDHLLLERVAQEVADNGLDGARAWLNGYAYHAGWSLTARSIREFLSKPWYRG